MSAVSLALAKEFIQIGHSAQDNAIQLMLDSAEDFLAKELGIDLASAEYTEDLPRVAGPLETQGLGQLPDYQSTGPEYLQPTHRPVTAIGSVVDRFANDAEYNAKLIGDRIAWADSDGRMTMGRWPVGLARFRVTYTAGYATVPPAIKEAICMLVARAYAARTGETSSSAGGASTNWGALKDSDVMKKVKQFSRKPIVGF